MGLDHAAKFRVPGMSDPSETERPFDILMKLEA